MSKSGRYAHIDAMRAYAVLVVVIAHAGLGHIIPGGSGVTIFFAISGFIITHLLLVERKRTGGFDLTSFYIRRGLKLAPPFIVIVAVPTLVYSAYEHVDWLLFSSQAFFFFNWIYMTNGDAALLPGSGVVWSLSIEEQFYIVFSLIWLLTVRSRHYVKCLAVLALIGTVVPLILRVVIALTDFSHHRIYYGTDTRLDGIAIGVLAAVGYYYLSEVAEHSNYVGVLSSDWTLGGAIFLYLMSLVIRDEVYQETISYSLQSIAAALVILYGLLPRPVNSGIRSTFYKLSGLSAVQIVGLSSYSIYLVHLQLGRAIQHTFPELDPGIAIGISSILGLMSGVLLWRIVEKPTERLKNTLMARFKSREAIKAG